MTSSYTESAAALLQDYIMDWAELPTAEIGQMLASWQTALPLIPADRAELRERTLIALGAARLVMLVRELSPTETQPCPACGWKRPV